MLAYVLIVVSYVHNGTMVNQQEFQNKLACESAAKVITDMQKKVSGYYKERFVVECVPKG